MLSNAHVVVRHMRLVQRGSERADDRLISSCASSECLRRVSKTRLGGDGLIFWMVALPFSNASSKVVFF